MKKLRMIVTAVTVLAIVGGAFAFKTKGVGRFCVLDPNAAGTNCTTYLAANQKTTTDAAGILWKYYPSFDGNPVTCTTTSNGLCTAQTRLTTD